MATELVIFDMDGTTVKSVDGIMYSMNLVLEKANFPTHDEEAYKGFIGGGTRALVTKALPEKNRTEEEIDKYCKEMLKTYGENWDYGLKLYDEIPEVLDYLMNKGIKIAINTNKADHLAKRIVDKLFDKWEVSCTIGDGEDLPKKPDPAGVYKIIEELKVNPEACIYVGDSGTDVQTAKNANIKSVGVTWGFRKRDDLLKADHIIDHPSELIDIL